MEQSKAIINLFHAGEPIPAISRKLGVPKTTFITILGSSRSWERQIGSLGSSWPGSTPTPSCPSGKSPGSWRWTRRWPGSSARMVKSRARMKKQFVNASCKEKRLKRSKMLLNVLKEKKQPVIFFTDEKIFDLDSISNSRLDRYLSPEKACNMPDHVRFKFQTKTPRM
jgi:hypothetical protein